MSSNMELVPDKKNWHLCTNINTRQQKNCISDNLTD